MVRLHSDPRNPALKIGDKYKVNKKTGKVEMPYGQHVMGPADFAQIYNLKPLYAANVDGTGQSIAIVSRSSLVDPNYNINGLQDIHDFRNVMSLPVNDPQMIINGDDPGVLSFEDTVEAMLDVTWAGAVAPWPPSKLSLRKAISPMALMFPPPTSWTTILPPSSSTSFGSCSRAWAAFTTLSITRSGSKLPRRASHRLWPLE